MKFVKLNAKQKSENEALSLISKSHGYTAMRFPHRFKNSLPYELSRETRFAQKLSRQTA